MDPVSVILQITMPIWRKGRRRGLKILWINSVPVRVRLWVLQERAAMLFFLLIFIKKDII